jgi:hypothetical protein
VALAENQGQQSPKVATAAGYVPLPEHIRRRRSLHRRCSLPAQAETSGSPVITILYRDHAKALRTVQRVILSRLLSEHYTLKWARADIELALRPQPAIIVNEALAGMRQKGVIEMTGDEVWPSESTFHLDGLETIVV